MTPLIKDTNFSTWLIGQLGEQGISAKQLAEKTGISEASLSRLKTGKTTLTPKMRGRLAQALSVSITDIPNPAPASQSFEQHPIQIGVLASPYADNSIFNTNIFKDLLMNHGVLRYTCPFPFISAEYPQGYQRKVKKLVTENRSVLVMGSARTLESDRVDDPNILRFDIPSHTYIGHALATRANTAAPSITTGEGVNDIVVLKAIFELLIDAQFQSKKKGYQHIAWTHDDEFNFLETVWGMANELICGVKYEGPRPTMPNPGKSLSSLNAMGERAVDLVVTDVCAYSRVLYEPKNYKVLFTQLDLKRIIRNISEENPPAWSHILTKLYKADRKSTAIARFKAFWLEKLNKLETPLDWHLFVPANHDTAIVEDLVARLKKIRHALEIVLTCPIQRTILQRQVYQALMTDDNYFDFESFSQAWSFFYRGL